MRLASLLVLAHFAAALILPATSKADDVALTARLQQLLDAYVKDRASIEGLSRRRIAGGPRRGQTDPCILCR